MRFGFFTAIAVAVLLLGLEAKTLAQSLQTPNTLKLEKKENMPRATIGDITWLAGHWIGEGMDGTVEEVWAPPIGNTMIGMFRLVKNGKLVFSELCYLTEEEGCLVLKIKHFDAKLKGWEEKDASVSFPLVKLTPREACFSGLTIRKGNDGSIQMFVAISQKDGGAKEAAFQYRPYKPEKPADAKPSSR